MNHEVKEHIRNALKKGIRIDGRGLEELRPINIEAGFLSTAEGSAKIICGEAEVLAGVKMSLGTPYPDTPEDGVLMVNSELLPISSPNFESGPPSIESIETARVIDRGIRESKSFDTKSLCVEKGEKVWMVAIDVVPLNYDGNLIDIGGVAAIAALKNARFPEVDKDGNVDYHSKSKETLKMQKVPIPVTVCKIGDLFIVDPTDEEEKAVDARLTVTVLEDDKICALQKGGNSSLSISDVEKMVDLAISTSKKLRALIDEVK